MHFRNKDCLFSPDPARARGDLAKDAVEVALELHRGAPEGRGRRAQRPRARPAAVLWRRMLKGMCILKVPTEDQDNHTHRC